MDFAKNAFFVLSKNFKIDLFQIFLDGCFWIIKPKPPRLSFMVSLLIWENCLNCLKLFSRHSKQLFKFFVPCQIWAKLLFKVIYPISALNIDVLLTFLTVLSDKTTVLRITSAKGLVSSVQNRVADVNHLQYCYKKLIDLLTELLTFYLILSCLD